MERGKQLGRVLRFIRLLARPEGISAIEAGRELGCDRRTVYRDRQLLEREGYSVYGDEDGDGGTWRLMAVGHSVDSVPFTRAELGALWLARESLARLAATSVADGARSALDKVRASLSRDERKRLDRLGQVMTVTGTSRRHLGVAHAMVALQTAAEKQTSIELRYRSLEGRESTRLFDPYLLWLDPTAAAIYAAGWDHNRGGIRTFLVDRIQSATPTDKPFRHAPDWNAQGFLKDSFAAFRGKPADIALTFTGRAAQLIAERTWHPSQELTSKGRIVQMRLRAPISPAFRAWVLSWMPEVRVDAPAELARDVVAALEKGTRLSSVGPGLRKTAPSLQPRATARRR